MSEIHSLFQISYYFDDVQRSAEEMRDAASYPGSRKVFLRKFQIKVTC